MIVLTVELTNLIAVLIPIILTVLSFILIIVVKRAGTGSSFRRYISYLVKPPRLGSNNLPEGERSTLLRDIKVRLFFVYLAIAVFLVSYVIGVFYEVVIDLALPVTQGNTGDIRTVTSIVFLSPFSAGWIGNMPWYGSLPAPAGLGTYHDTWSWIFATAAFTDNPNFLGTMVSVLLMISMIVGVIFLIPLALKPIRRALLPSVFFFTVGMTLFTKTAVGGLGQALALTLGAQLRFGIMTATASLIPDLNEVIGIGFLIVIAMYAFFVLLGRRLWKVHYDDLRSRNWFTVYVSLVFWIGLALSIVV